MLLLLLMALTQAVERTSPSAARALNDPLTSRDYPKSALRSHASGYTETETLISPDGKALHCRITRPSGVPDLDRATCSLIMRRARFAAARDATGKPSFGTIRKITSWLAADSPQAVERLKLRYPKPRETVLDLKVRGLPKGIVSPVEVTLTVAVSDRGAITSCTLTSPTTAEALEAAGCQQVLLLQPLVVALSPDGTAVSTIRDLKVAFSTAE